MLTLQITPQVEQAKKDGMLLRNLQKTGKGIS